MQHHYYKIIKWSLLSRVAVVLLSVLSSSLVPTYDLSFDVHSSPSSSSLDPASTSSSIFDSLARWDGVYFIRLAETNLMYEFEQFHAFFPLLPAAIHHCTHFITSLFSFQTTTTTTSATLGLVPAAIPRAHYIAVGVVLTNLAFVVASLLLYRLGLMVFGPRQHTKAYASVLLFCLSPASIFFSSVYTESVFAMFSFGFMVCYLHVVQTIDARRKTTSGSTPPSLVHLLPWWVGCVVCGVLATFTRSNGVVLGAYPLHYAVINVYRELSRHRRKRNTKNTTPNTQNYARKNTVNIAVITVMAIVVALCTALPLAYVDRMGRALYCHTNSSGGDGDRPWCGMHGGSLYTFVQKEYWNQGLFNYWRMDQLPNFALAFPVLFSCGVLFYTYVQQYNTLWNVRVLGCVTEAEEEEEEREEERGTGKGVVVPFVFHCVALSVLCFFAMHVQVATRFILASSPMCYWFWYDVLSGGGGDRGGGEGGGGDEGGRKNRQKWCRRCLVGYIWVFNVVGIVLFSSFYPWT